MGYEINTVMNSKNYIYDARKYKSCHDDLHTIALSCSP